jgi:hypothetical protein
MSIPNTFDLAAFQADVLKEVAALEKEDDAAAKGPSPSNWRAVLEGASADPRRAAEARQAEADLKRRDVRAVICPGLKDFSGDTVTLATVLTPILVGAALGGTLAIPLTPFYIGVIVVLVARAGVSSLCAGIKTAEDKA